MMSSQNTSYSQVECYYMKKVYYESFSDELVKNSNQDYKLKDNFKWIHNSIIYNIYSYIVDTFILFP